jgi:ATP-dependent DNA helicase PIF1
MSRATARMSIKILALPPNVEEEEKHAKRKTTKWQNKGQGNQHVKENKKRVPTLDLTYTKNIIYTKRFLLFMQR